MWTCLKARVRPFGEKAGCKSPTDFCDGEVSGRRSPVVTETANSLNGPSAESSSAIISQRPPGCHAGCHA